MKKSVINYLSANLSKRVNQPRAIISLFPKEQQRPSVKTCYVDFSWKKTQNSEYINIFHRDVRKIWDTTFFKAAQVWTKDICSYF